MSKVAVKAPFVRSPYNYDRDAASDESGIECKDPSLAQQHFKDDCDMNIIVERFLKTGIAPFVDQEALAPGEYEMVDYHSALNLVRNSQSEFMKLPAEVRYRFDNDPGKLIDFLNNEDNRDEAVELGILARPAEEPARDGRKAGVGAREGAPLKGSSKAKGRAGGANSDDEGGGGADTEGA